MNARGDSILTQYDVFQRPTRVTLKRGSAVLRTDNFAYDTDPRRRWIAGENAHSRDTVYTDPTGWVDSVATRFLTDVNLPAQL